MHKQFVRFNLFVILIMVLTTSISYAQQFNIKLLKRFYSIGTAGINGTYYPLGGAISHLFNNKFPDIAVVSEPTKGSVANIAHLREKQIDLALVQSDVAFQAFTGTGRFKNQPFNELKIMASLYPEVLHIVVLNNSTIKSIQNLKGKTISIGSAKSGSAISSKAILNAIGIASNSCKLVYERFTKGTASLKDGYIDALMYTGGIPANGITLLAEKNKIRLIPIPPDIANIIIKKMPYMTKETIAKASYFGINNDVKSIGIRALLISSDRLDNSMAHDMIKAIFENTASISKLCKAGAMINIKDALKGLNLEMLHPGARKYFEETGLLKTPQAPKP